MHITIGLVDDHVLFSKSLAVLIETLGDIHVTLEATNGEELKQKLLTITSLPDVLLVDVDMPIMNGVQTAKWVKEKFPAIYLVALSMKDDDVAIIQMIRAGCCAYLLKDIHPDELAIALKEIKGKGFYNSDVKQRNYMRLISGSKKMEIQLNEIQLQFLKLASSDLTYKQIADKMNKATRTVDGYRESLFEILNVESRVGMVLEAVRKNLITI
jgi:DNA-binding NarL/FixJ family response regulator